MFNFTLPWIFVVFTFVSAQSMIGVGKWTVLNIVKCPEHIEYPMNFDIVRKKVNRSHDGFTGKLKFDETIDDKYGITLDICKYLDGGCKPFQVIKEDCFCSFLKKYAKENMEKVLRMAELDPPDCPLPEGEYTIKDFVFNYYELPEKGLFGKYDAKAFITTKDTFQDKIVGCLVVTLTFEKDDRNND